MPRIQRWVYSWPDVQAFLTKPGVCIPRMAGSLTPDPKRRGNPDHQIHLLLLEHLVGMAPVQALGREEEPSG